MQQIYIMRHGESAANAAKQVNGVADSPLSPLGEQQVALASKTIRQHFAIDVILSSPMQRALQTARLVAGEIGLSSANLIVVDSLRERNLGSLEGMDYAHAPQHSGNYEDVEKAPGVEPLQAFYDRATQALQIAQQRPEGSVLLVCHNGIGRMLRVVARQSQPHDLYRQPRLEQAIIYRL